MPLKIDKLKPLELDWDEHNKEKNWEKHKVNFKECEEIFFNEPLKTFYDIKHSQEEVRFIALGKTDENRRLFIVFTIRNKKNRVISAREMSKKETRIYEQK
jgi:hypothetical protein